MSKRKLTTLILSAFLVLVLGGTLSWAYFTGRISPKADVLSTKKAVNITSYDFVPGEVIVKINGTKVRNIKSISAESVQPNKTGLSTLDKINKKYEAEEMKLILKPTDNTRAKSLETNNLSGLYKIKFKTTQEELDKEVQTNQYDTQANNGSNNEAKNKVSAAHLKTKEIINDLNSLSEVDYAEPNYILYLGSLPNDTYVDPDQNNTWSTGAWSQNYEDLWNLKRIEADRAWEISQGEGIKVAVVDSGVDYNQEDIKNNILRDEQGNIVGYDFANNDNDPMDDNYHGTHVAGIIAATKNNGKGIAGVAPEAKIMPIKISGNAGSFPLEKAVSGIDYAISHGAQVINASWGADYYINSLEDIVNYAISQNIIIVACAGNSGWYGHTWYPAKFSSVISVGASTFADKVSRFTNAGKIDVVAPGGEDVCREYPTGTFRNIDSNNLNILSLRSSQAGSFAPGGNNIVNTNYLRAAGTSMATPQVSGLAALLLSHAPNLTVNQARALIVYGSQRIDNNGIAETFDRINAYQSLNNKIPDANNSQISAKPSQLAADGVTKAKINVRLKDFKGNPVSSRNVVLISSRADDIITQPNDASGGGVTNDSGETFGYVSSTVPGTSGIGAVDTTWSDDDIVLVAKVNVEFTSDGVTDLTVSQIFAEPTQLAADGVDKTKVTVKLKDFKGNPVIHKNVVINSSRANDILTQPNDVGGGGVTNASGETYGYVASKSVGSSDIGAADITWSDNNIALKNKAQVTFKAVGKEITLYSGQVGNFVSFPMSSPQIDGLSSSDKIYAPTYSWFWNALQIKWLQINSTQIHPGIAYKITTNTTKKITISGGTKPAKPYTVNLVDKGRNYIANPFKTNTSQKDVYVRYQTKFCSSWGGWFNTCKPQFTEESLSQAVKNNTISSPLNYYDGFLGQYRFTMISDKGSMEPYVGYWFDFKKTNGQLIFK